MGAAGPSNVALATNRAPEREHAKKSVPAAVERERKAATQENESGEIDPQTAETDGAFGRKGNEKKKPTCSKQKRETAQEKKQE